MLKLLAYGPARTHAEAFHNRGLAFAAKGNLDQAIADVSAGIRLDPQRAYRWQERGELYTRQESTSRVLRTLLKRSGSM